VIGVLTGHTNYVNDVAFGEGGVLVLRARTARRERGAPAAVQFTSSGDTEGPLRKPSSGAESSSPPGPTARCGSGSPGTRPELVAVPAVDLEQPRKRARSPNGRTTAVVDGRLVRLLSQGGERVLDGHTDLVNAVDFNTDGTRLVTAGRDHDVVAWDVAAAAPLERLDVHFGSVVDARFSPDGRWIVTAGPTTAGLLNVENGRFRGYLRGPKSRLTAAAFEHDSLTIVTREQDGTVRRYRCELCGATPDLIRLAVERLGATRRTLAEEERRRYEA